MHTDCLSHKVMANHEFQLLPKENHYADLGFKLKATQQYLSNSFASFFGRGKQMEKMEAKGKGKSTFFEALTVFSHKSSIFLLCRLECKDLCRFYFLNYSLVIPRGYHKKTCFELLLKLVAFVLRFRAQPQPTFVFGNSQPCL